MNSFNFAAEGDRARDPAADRDLRVGRRGRPGDAALRPRQRGGAAAAHQGGGAGLPLLPGARPRPARAGGGAGRAPARRAARAAVRRGSARLEPEVGFALAEGLVTAARDGLYLRTPWRARGGGERADERARGGGRRSGNGERRGARKVIARRTRSRRPRSPRRWRRVARTASRPRRTSAETAIADVGELDPVIDRILARTSSRSRLTAAAKRGCSGSSSGR